MAGTLPHFTVSTQSKSNDVGIMTLLGDYTEAGMNHGRKYFKKMQKIKGHEDISVFLYYWDQRDGVDFGGWWFGDQLGGSQVWARANFHGDKPPRLGWKIPWDAPKAEPGILLCDPATTSRPATAPVQPTGFERRWGSPGGVTASTETRGPLSERVNRSVGLVETAEKESESALAKVREVLAAEPSEAAVRDAAELLQSQQKTLIELQTAITNDVAEARKNGAEGSGAVAEFSKLSPKVRNAQRDVTAELNKVRAVLTQLQASSKAEYAKEQQKRAEEHDAKDLEDTMPGVREQVDSAEAGVATVLELASPLLADPPSEGGAFDAAMDSIENTASEAQEKILEARKQVNLKLQAARSYAPETRKRALAEMSVLQQKLTEAQNKLNPFKSFKKDFFARIEARRQLGDTVAKMDYVELEVEKASMVTGMSDKGSMTDEDVAAAEEMIMPLQKDLMNELRILEGKLRQSQGPMRDELTCIRDRAISMRKKLESIVLVLRRQREGKLAEQVLALAEERVEQAEQALAACHEAEMPFLKGLEILPQEESAQAIASSEEAAARSDVAINQAKAFIRAKLNEAKRFSADLIKSTVESLTALSARAETASRKLVTFKRETSERKTASLLAEVVEAIAGAERKVEAVSAAAKPFMADCLEMISAEGLKDAAEKVAAVEEEATSACVAAKKLIVSKQKEAKGPDASAAISKLMSRLNTAQQDLAKQLAAAKTGDKLVSGKETALEMESRIADAESEVQRVEDLAKPIQCDEGEELEDQTLEELGAAFVNGQKVLKQATSAVELKMADTAPVVRAALQKLVERLRRASERLTAVLAATKGQKQKMLSMAYLREGRKQTEEVEEHIRKVNDVELPFLKGIEVLPLKEATDTIAESEALVASVQQAISEARTFIASKNLEIKQFEASTAKPVAEEFIKQTERINSAAAKLSQFKRDTEARKKTAQMQEAGESISVLEGVVRKLVEAVEPFMAESMTEEEASQLCQELAGQVKEVQAKMDSTRAFLAARQKDAKSGGSLHNEALQKLQERLSESMVELSKAKKVISDNEQKFTAKQLLAEARTLMEKMDKDLAGVTTASAPLLEKGGEEFLVANSVQTLASVLGDHMQAKGLTQQELFVQANGGKKTGKITAEAFCAWLEKLPAETEREELTFTAARRAAMAKQMDGDGDGALELADLQRIFKKEFVCRESITLTDVFEISDSKTKGKVEPGSFLEAVGLASKCESTGLTRIECRVLSSGKTGYATMVGNQGTIYLEAVTPFSNFNRALEKALAESVQSITAISNFLKSKTAELAKVGTKGPLSDMRTEFGKMRPKVMAAQGSHEGMKKKLQVAKNDFARRELAEKNAHIEAREKRAAEAMTQEANVKVEAMEANLRALDEALQPLTSLSGPDLDAFSTPATLLEESERLQGILSDSIAAARAIIKEKLAGISKNPKGPMLEAKRELAKMEGRSGLAERRSAKAMEAAFTACQTIVDARYSEAAVALREEAKTRGLSPEELFASLLQGEDRIPQDVFASHLSSLDGTFFLPEHIKLLCQHIEVGGIGRRKFLALLQQYFVVIKSIAITNEFEISKAKTIRKAETDEVIEVLEGPRTDTKVGLTRVKGKSLIDGQEGWITVNGNQGTPFLQEMEKPYYACTCEVVLQSTFSTDVEDDIRTLAADEVLELLEGPRKEAFSPTVRVRGRAASDSATGWFTVKDSKGRIFAEADGQYYACTTSVALTDHLDIKSCSVLRKLTEGEVFAVLEGPTQDRETVGITRVRGRAMKDDMEGWITIRGNAGTVYAAASSKHYTVTAESLPLQRQLASGDAEAVRSLERGEALQVLEGPKEEPRPSVVRVRGRALSDGAVGWITLKAENVRPWSPYFSCLHAAPLQDAPVAEGASLVREITVGEVVELLEGPTKEEGQESRMKVRAERDGAIGWVTVKSNSGTKFFES